MRNILVASAAAAGGGAFAAHFQTVTAPAQIRS